MVIIWYPGEVQAYCPYFGYANAVPYQQCFYPGGIAKSEEKASMRIDSGARVFAEIKGGPLAPQIIGNVVFKGVPGGTEVTVTVNGLPQYKPAQGENPPVGPHGFHIHQNGTCEAGDPNAPFTAAGEHWNPANQPHGNHAGDFPVLFSNDGYARMTFFTNKFKPVDVIGKAVIIHESPDDYRTQPAGAAGRRLACGVIRRG